MKILNGNVAKDKEEEYTYVGNNGDTVINYVIGTEKIRRVKRLKVGDQIDSDY